MPAIRLPQSIQEIQAAAKQVVDAAYPDLQASGNKNLVASYHSDRKIVAGWLATLGGMGALMNTDLVTHAELMLNRSSEQLQGLRPGRVVAILSRRTWVHGKVA